MMRNVCLSMCSVVSVMCHLSFVTVTISLVYPWMSSTCHKKKIKVKLVKSCSCSELWIELLGPHMEDEIDQSFCQRSWKQSAAGVCLRILGYISWLVVVEQRNRWIWACMSCRRNQLQIMLSGSVSGSLNLPPGRHSQAETYPTRWTLGRHCMI